ncbi:MAG: rhomboid family intramembrane serine protease [Actinomycetota bacterium]
MLFLVVFGNNIEDRMRKLPYLAFYLACGYAAAYGFALANPSSAAPLTGASGAISAILGAYLGALPAGRGLEPGPVPVLHPGPHPAWLVLGLWFVLQWAYSAGVGTEGAGSVAYLAHIFGFLAGVLVGVAMRLAAPQPSGGPAGR